jgi:hypothetical protein
MELSLHSDTGVINVSDAVFDVKFNETLVHQSVTAYLAAVLYGAYVIRVMTDAKSFTYQTSNLNPLNEYKPYSLSSYKGDANERIPALGIVLLIISLDVKIKPEVPLTRYPSIIMAEILLRLSSTDN